MIDKYTEDIAVDGSLIQKERGFVPQYDLKTGWEETIKEMRRSGELWVNAVKREPAFDYKFFSFFSVSIRYINDPNVLTDQTGKTD